MLNRKLILGISLLSGISLIGLVFIQVYWIQSAIEQRKSQFEDNVKKSLVEVVYDVDRYEAISRMNKNAASKDLLNQILQKGGKVLNNHATYLDELDTVFNAIHDKFNVQIVEKHIFNKESGSETNHKIISQKYGNDTAFTIEITDTTPSKFNAVSRDLWSQKTEIVEELVSDIFSFDFFGSNAERITQPDLDSIIESVLKKNGINTKYQMGVFDVMNHSIYDLKDNNQSDLYESPFKISLFPNDIFGSPLYLSMYFPNENAFILKSMWMMLAISAIFVLIIIFAFYYSISTILKQKKLSIIKNDFINNMTHELKTPISTISLACEALNDKGIANSKETQGRFVNMINEENKRLGVLVENVLQSAVIDKGELTLNEEFFNIHDVIDRAVKNVKIQVEKKNGQITMSKLATKEEVYADNVHITNVIYNLLDNANKYTAVQPSIEITTEDIVGGIVIKVKDNGVGISKENQQKVFEKLYRVPTGNVHDVKGFGLGLSYVKAIVQKHDGTIVVESTLGKGSTFVLTLPMQKEKDNE